MSLFRMMNIGYSGMIANSFAMNVIGDNIANMNTIGFKKSRAVFADVVGSQVAGWVAGSRQGIGTEVQDSEKMFAQGSMLSTGSSLDLAINGNGFFVVRGDHNGINSNYYTRAGQFHVDKEGYLIDVHGLRAQGYGADDQGNIVGGVGDMYIGDKSTPATVTSSITMNANLQADVDSIPGGFDVADPDNTSNFSNVVTVYDSLGNAHDVTVYFTKTADNTWDYNVVVPGDDHTSGTDQICAAGTLTFNTEGALQSQTTTMASDFDFVGATQDQVIDMTFGDPIADGGTGFSGTTQYASDYSVTFQSQDGASSGNLQSVYIDEGGLITGVFSNGEKREIGQLALATFKGMGLDGVGGNLYTATKESGDPSVGAAGTGGRGGIQTSMLEQSNVDLTEEFVNLITAQRGFQASSKSISTADSLLQEVVNLRR